MFPFQKKNQKEYKKNNDNNRAINNSTKNNKLRMATTTMTTAWEYPYGRRIWSDLPCLIHRIEMATIIMYPWQLAHVSRHRASGVANRVARLRLNHRAMVLCTNADRPTRFAKATKLNKREEKLAQLQKVRVRDGFTLGRCCMMMKRWIARKIKDEPGDF